MPMNHIVGLLAACLVPSLLVAQAEPDVRSSDARGIYAIWYGKNTDVLRLPYVKGGQVILQWADLEPQEGKYDFTSLDAAMAPFAAANERTTVQVNGNDKPRWMFDVIPHHTEKLSQQVDDDDGTLMFWHPRFIKAYVDFINAYAAHVKSSPYRAALAGVRMNFNAIGTEQLDVPPAKQSLDQWVSPRNVAQGPAYGPQTSQAYQDEIVSTFADAFDGVNLFLRDNISPEQERKFGGKLLSGQLMLFHTSSEMEPRNPALEHFFGFFIKYARSGHTLAYAEPWADVWGSHGAQQDPRWASPAQYNYWRLLSDLNLGVSLIAVHGSDLRVALGVPDPQHADRSQNRQAFEQAYRFASLYAGNHASPSVAPGAWVAFRHNERTITGQQLTVFTDDYSYLMTQLSPDNTVWQDVRKVGPPLQRFGAWAKTLPARQTLRLQLSARYAESLRGKPAVVRIVYLDGDKGAFAATGGGKSVTTALTGTGQWRTLEVPLQSAEFVRDGSGADITVTATDGDVTFHMVNVERGSGLPNDVRNATVTLANGSASVRWTNPPDYDIDHINVYDDGKLVLTVPMTETEAVVRDARSGTRLRITTVDEAGRESAGVTPGAR